MDFSDFLICGHSPNEYKWFSDSISKANAIHRKKKTTKKLNAADRTQLKEAYDTIGRCVQQCDSTVFQELVPPHEFKAWLIHSIEVFRQISEDPQWIRTGTMLQYELSFLKAQVALMDVAALAVMAFETDFFQALASLVSTRRGASNNALSAETADWITFLVGHVLNSCADNKWKPEKSFKKLEATGVLEQFLFCSAISRHERADKAIAQILKKLLKCPAFVRKRFKKGTPCGDTARTILRSDHEHRTYRPVATRFLDILVRFSSAMQPIGTIQACLCCKSSSPSKDFQSKLMQCSRCRLVYYCSKECQLADWKKHKKMCKCLSRNLSGSGETHKKIDFDDISNVFTHTNYATIMKALVVTCDKSGVEKKDIVIELNFAPDSTGKIPALQDPPEFNIVPIKRYFDGSRLLESDGIFHRREGAMQKGLGSSILHGLTHNRNNLKSTGLLYICNHIGGMAILRTEQEQSQIYSQEAVEAFRLAMNDNDFGPIADICRGDDNIMDLLRADMGMPDDESTTPNAA